MLKATAKQGQTYFDIALQMFGSIEGVFGLTGGSISDQPEPGTELTTSDTVINKYVADEYLNQAITPATGLVAALAPGEGIGYWIIANDFIIS